MYETIPLQFCYNYRMDIEEYQQIIEEAKKTFFVSRHHFTTFTYLDCFTGIQQPFIIQHPN